MEEEGFEPPELGENEYVHLDLRRSDGRSVASEEGDTPSPVSSTGRSESDQDSVSSAGEESPLLLPACRLDERQLSIELTDVPDDNPPLVSSIPRPTPEGCSDTSSTRSSDESDVPQDL